MMNMKVTTLASAAFLSAALVGCGHSEIDTVKSAVVPQDSTHTYESALSSRSSCEKDSWSTFKDDANRTVVEYRCELKNGAPLLAAFRQQKIIDTQRDFQGYYKGLDQSAETLRQRDPEALEKQLADTQRQLSALQANGSGPMPNTPEALKQSIVNRDSALEAAQSAVNRAQQALGDARGGQAGVQQERARFEQQEKDALAQIDKTYGGVTGASEVFRWYVRDKQVAPAWVGVELAKQDGSTVRQDRNWQQNLQNLLNHRGDDHVHAVLNVPDSIVASK